MTDREDLCILLVDDNPVNIKLLETALVKEGYRIISAMDGRKARELAQEVLPDLILLDIVMPEEDGFETIRQLKANSETTSIPVIFLTSKYELDAKVTGFDLGAVDYITKPFHIQEVLARVRLHLKLSFATNSLIASQAQKLKQIRDAQSSMLVGPDEIPEAKFNVHYLSLLEAGGDFYDVFKISDGIFGYFLGDVSGHDIATSYITAAIKALLKQNCTPIYRPVESMKMINNVLVEILPDEKHMTACYARLNRKSKTMTIVNAGHPPVVYASNDGKPNLIEAEGDVLGIFNNVHYQSQDIRVEPGERFYLYTDGLIEKPGAKKIWTGRLEELLGACCKITEAPLSESVDMLMESMLGKSAQHEDDIVVMGIEV